MLMMVVVMLLRMKVSPWRGVLMVLLLLSLGSSDAVVTMGLMVQMMFAAPGPLRAIDFLLPRMMMVVLMIVNGCSTFVKRIIST